MFLIRTAFWLCLVILLLPTGENEGSDTQAGLSTQQAIGMVGATMQDIRGFCARNPDACVAGSEALRTFGSKAETGARMVYDYISGLNADADNGHVTDASGLRPMIDAGTNTLTAEDLAPEWRGPVDSDDI